jgi:hypothetical protein
MKRIAKICLTILGAILLLIAAMLLQNVEPALQKSILPNPYSFDDTLANHSYDLDSLKHIIGTNKGLPPGFEIAGAIAYSAYPELKDVKIDMVFINGGAPMEARPKILTLFGLRKNRRYLILLNNEQHSYFEPILLRSLPFDAQVGVLAHELGHIVFYEQLNTLQLGKWGLNYLRNDDFRATHERATDLMPVYHGLGSQIYQYAYFVRKDPTCRAFYEEGKDFMDKYYMTDDELAASLKE